MQMSVEKLLHFIWVKKTDEKTRGTEGDEDDREIDYSNDISTFDHTAVYKQTLVMSGESVAKYLQRPGELIMA
jgi:hypothetical protein